MNNAGPGGFAHAPVTKFMVLASAGVSLVAHFLRKVPTLCLSTSVLTRGEVWRLFTHPFLFAGPGELILGLSSLYFFRMLERQLGARKYAAFVVFSLSLNTVTELALLSLWPIRSGNPTVPLFSCGGPLAFIFSGLVQYYLDVPVSVRFRVMGQSLSDKGFVYIIVGQMFMLNISFYSSVRSALAGVFTGLLYHSDALPFYDMVVPEALAKPFTSVLGPFLVDTGPSPALARLISTQRANQRQWQQQGAVVRPPGAAPGGDGRADAVGGDGGVAAQGYTDTLIPEAGQMGGMPPAWGLYSRAGARGGAAAQAQAQAQAHAQQAHVAQAVAAAVAATGADLVPDAEAVSQLVNMGFPRQTVEEVLRMTQNDVNRATNILLDQST